MIGVGLIPMEFSLGPLAPEHLEEFIVGLVLAIIVAVGVQKIAVPKFEQMFNERANAIEGGINRAQVIQQEAEETKRHYQEQLAQSREEAAALREQARAQGQQIIAVFPEFERRVGLFDVDAMPHVVAKGREAAHQALPQIEQALARQTAGA